MEALHSVDSPIVLFYSVALYSAAGVLCFWDAARGVILQARELGCHNPQACQKEERPHPPHGSNNDAAFELF